MFIPEWFIIAVAIFILVLLVRLAQLYSHIEELQDAIAKLDETPDDEKSELEGKSDADSGGD
jgi:hypothetical protein